MQTTSHRNTDKLQDNFRHIPTIPYRTPGREEVPSASATTKSVVSVPVSESAGRPVHQPPHLLCRMPVTCQQFQAARCAAPDARCWVTLRRATDILKNDTHRAVSRLAMVTGNLLGSVIPAELWRCNWMTIYGFTEAEDGRPLGNTFVRDLFLTVIATAQSMVELNRN